MYADRWVTQFEQQNITKSLFFCESSLLECETDWIEIHSTNIACLYGKKSKTLNLSASVSNPFTAEV